MKTSSLAEVRQSAARNRSRASAKSFSRSTPLTPRAYATSNEAIRSASTRENVSVSAQRSVARAARSASPRRAKNSIAPRAPTKLANDSLNEV